MGAMFEAHTFGVITHLKGSAFTRNSRDFPQIPFKEDGKSTFPVSSHEFALTQFEANSLSFL